jgi:hypothetical protein
MKSTIALTTLALGLSAFASAQTVPLFSTLQRAPSGLAASTPTFPAAGDFNGDGIPDIAVGDTSGGTVNILLGDGRGGFQTPRLYPAGTSPQCVAVGDFNRDGKLDVVVANGDSGGTISVLLGNGDGTLRPAIALAVVANPNWVAAADFNGDGKLDIVVTGNNTYQILLGNGLGGFSPLAPVTLAPLSTAIPTPSIPVVVGDLNADGRPDLVMTGPVGTIEMTGNGDGTFASPVGIAPASYSPAALGDFNGDGKLDVAVTITGNQRNGHPAQLWIALSSGAGTFTLQLAGGFSVPSGGYDLFVGNPVVADFNGDGKLDVVVKDVGTNVFFFPGNGDGTWQHPSVAGQMPGDLRDFLVIADFDRNGSPDLLQSEVGDVSVLRNTGGNPPMLALLTLNPATAQAGVTVAQATVFLGSPAPASGAIVNLSIADPTSASLPGPTLFVPPGSASATFAIIAYPVVVQVATTVTATYNGITLTAGLTVVPPPPPLALSSLTLDRTGAFGSIVATPVNFAFGIVTVNTPPLGAGIVVTLTSSNPALAVLSSSTVTIGAGTTSNVFTVTAPQPVAADTPVTITATYQGVTKTVTLTILKPQDKLTITKAQFDSVKKVIQIEAASTVASAQLGVWDTSTGQFLFWLTPTGGGKSSIQIASTSVQYPATVPANITVRSTLGGIQSGAMAVK